MTTRATAPRIAIIGAGPGGLTLARLLHVHHIPCTIFELDASRSAREQGGMIDLHAGSGQLALERAGLVPAFHTRARPAAEAMRLLKSDGRVLWDENTLDIPGLPPRNRPEIDRADLRNLLLDALPPDTIRWNAKLLAVRPTPDVPGKHDLHFADGTVVPAFDLVVGTDGAWSRVRPLLTPEAPAYAGVTLVELTAAHASTAYPWLVDFTGAGSAFMFAAGRALVAQHNGADRIRVYAAARVEETWLDDCGIDWAGDARVTREAVVAACFADCGADVRRAILEPADGLVVRRLYALPVGLTWDGVAGVTLLGDAAHLMTPFAGVGVNVAMADALALAERLVAWWKGVGEAGEGSRVEGLGKAVRAYEEEMFERARENAEKTLEGLRGHFSEDGVERRVEKLNARVRMLQERRAREAGAGA